MSEPLPGRGTPATQEARLAAVRTWLDEMDRNVPDDRAVNAETRHLLERAVRQPRLRFDGPPVQTEVGP